MIIKIKGLKMKIKTVIKYLEKRDLTIISYGNNSFLTVNGWININGYKKLSDFNFLLNDI